MHVRNSSGAGGKTERTMKPGGIGTTNPDEHDELVAKGMALMLSSVLSDLKVISLPYCRCLFLLEYDFLSVDSAVNLANNLGEHKLVRQKDS